LRLEDSAENSKQKLFLPAEIFLREWGCPRAAQSVQRRKLVPDVFPEISTVHGFSGTPMLLSSDLAFAFTDDTRINDWGEGVLPNSSPKYQE
jgi:hypothetical protein